MSVSLNELPQASFDKRHFSRHYSFFDSADLTTITGYNEDTALAAALALYATTPITYTGNTLYTFGFNTRNKIINLLTGATAGRANWPVGCYGREILFQCTQNARVALITTNPEYLKELVIQNATGGRQRTSSSPLLYEKEFYLPADDYKRRFTVYGYALVFRADTVSGTLRVDVGASVEGDES